MVNERTADGPPSLIDVLEACRVAQSYKVDADRWRRAHEIVERERDQAREERDDAEQRYRDTAKALTEWHGRWVEMERDRDEWRARAEAAGVAGTRNQLAAVHPDQPADWHVQTGTVEWETP